MIRHRSAGLLNLATGQSVSYSDLARMVARLFPSSIEIKGTPRQNPVTNRAFDVAALHRAFPTFWFTTLEKSLAAAHQEEMA